MLSMPPTTPLPQSSRHILLALCYLPQVRWARVTAGGAPSCQATAAASCRHRRRERGGAGTARTTATAGCSTRASEAVPSLSTCALDAWRHASPSPFFAPTNILAARCSSLTARPTRRLHAWLHSSATVICVTCTFRHRPTPHGLARRQQQNSKRSSPPRPTAPTLAVYSGSGSKLPSACRASCVRLTAAASAITCCPSACPTTVACWPTPLFSTARGPPARVRWL
mmetsp:Transcript_66554/g.160676  ORF Transcript_66554/g.160676 Transcript_66554/m.160676 type:complete len:226 (-) Transcript_66554:245-922(-)